MEKFPAVLALPMSVAEAGKASIAIEESMWAIAD